MKRFLRHTMVTMLLLLCATRAQAIIWFSTNWDYATIEAVVATYAAETSTEVLTGTYTEDIKKNYLESSIASVGIFATKWMDRKALTNAGLLSGEENYYYNAIRKRLMHQTMPLILDIVTMCVKHPERAIYWGPYIYSTSEEIKNLCAQFQCVVTNGKLSFEDIAFITFKDEFKLLFDLSRLGNVDWKEYFKKLTHVDIPITRDDIKADLETLWSIGQSIASAGKGGGGFRGTASKVYKAFKDKYKDIKEIKDKYEEVYDMISNSSFITNELNQRLGNIDSLKAGNLIEITSYYANNFFSDYIGSGSNTYYTQRYYIYYIQNDVKVIEFEKVLDTYSMTEEGFMDEMRERQEKLNNNDEGRKYYIGYDPKHYYSATDENKMKDCEKVTFTRSCNEGVKFGEGSFQWKVNDRHGSSLEEYDKQRAFDSTIDSQKYDEDLSQINSEMSQLNYQINRINSEINILEAENDDLYAIRNDPESTPQEKSDAISKIYQNDRRIRELEREREQLEEQYKERQAALDEYREDMSNEEDGVYRIPALMQDIVRLYNVTWTDEGRWQGFTWVRHCKIPNLETEVTLRATLSLVRKEKRVLGIRIHRAILGVSWTLTSDYESSEVIDVMTIDPTMSEDEKAQKVNERYQELVAENPSCRIERQYEYRTNEKAEGDVDSIHLLWVSDRIAVARDVNARLAEINGKLMLIAKFLRYQLNMERFLGLSDTPYFVHKNKIIEDACQHWIGVLTGINNNMAKSKK